MTEHTSPEIILYDLACIKNACFSPVVWRIRLILNYKCIPYRTVFVEFPDIEPTMKELGLACHDANSGSNAKYTVPVIRHIPTDICIMDSPAIAEFLEATYPTPPLPLTSELGREIETKARRAVAPTFGRSIVPREIHILSPRSQEYFRRTQEARLGQRLEDLCEPAKEKEIWEVMSDKIRAAGELMLTHQADGPFVLGAQPSYTDFFIAGSLQSARMISEDVFQRFHSYPGFMEIYMACAPYLEKKD
ncbi:hypothetical protein B0I35DRAFT_357061 [Stachybotrys elegans]|uniref:GST N-terminal domain-containing protein n=1 Tax=Stachybotrys elegans TaxID=80388 RepID=A0A8K0WMX0_9HYPO|nr:hypothetical protein B0I35DRAFT_357061 [Stachybotrys elegans]